MDAQPTAEEGIPPAEAEPEPEPEPEGEPLGRDGSVPGETAEETIARLRAERDYALRQLAAAADPPSGEAASPEAAWVSQLRPLLPPQLTLGEVIPSMPGGPALARAAAATWPPTYAQFHSPKMSCPTLDVRVVFTKSLTLFSVHLSLVLLLLLTLFPRVPSYLKP